MNMEVAKCVKVLVNEAAHHCIVPLAQGLKMSISKIKSLNKPKVNANKNPGAGI